MIDEVYEVEEYLNGKVVSERGRYRAAYLIARWFTQEGMDFCETRNAIFEWSKRTGNYIKYNVNDIVTGARACSERLTDNVNVRISEKDINRIVLSFDSSKARILALAILCFAKTHANRDGVFNISISALAEWIGLSRSSINTKYLPELITLGYVERVDAPQAITRWHRDKEVKTSRYKSVRLKINAPLYNAGKYELHNNDIHTLYDDIFVQTERTVYNLTEEDDAC